MRATGEFSRVGVERMRGELSRAKFNLDRLEEDLAKKRAAHAAGEAEAEARKIGAALKDPTYREAIAALDAAEVVNDKAARAFERCKVSAKTGQLTRTGEKRKAEKVAALRAMDAARIAFREIDEAHGGVAAGGPNVGPRLSAQRLKGKLRQLLDSYKIGGLPDLVEEAQAEHDALDRKFALVLAHRVTDAKLKAFARYLDVKPRMLLVRLAVEGYKPKPTTVAKLDEELAALAEVGLSDGVRPTDLGTDVAVWVAENMAGQAGGSRRPALSAAEVRECFTQEQLRQMVAKGRRALALIAREGPGVEDVELGLPEEGVSYRIIRTADAVQAFLRVVASGVRKVKREGSGPTLLRKKVPTFTPGEIFEEDPSPVGAA